MAEQRNLTVPAVHGRQQTPPDDPFEAGLANWLKGTYAPRELAELYPRFASGVSALDERMRRALWRALAKHVGDGLRLGAGVGFTHAETFEIGAGVFVGDYSYLQGRIGGTCVIGHHVWIGPQSYFDARDLIIGDYVGWGPGAKVLGSAHTGSPAGVPFIQTDLEIKPVRIGAWADVGVNAVILPGVTLGKGSIVGAGAVVAKDVAPFAVVAGVPATFLHWRPGYESAESRV